MKKWVFFLIILVLLGVVNQGAQQDSGIGKEDHVIQHATITDTRAIEITKDQVYQGQLMLVNKKNRIQASSMKYEPQDYRYVGQPHRTIMKEHRFTLEKYLGYLKKHGAASIVIEGKKYDVMYYPISKNTTIYVPADRHYEISGNNIDGVIVTLYK